VRVGIRLYSAVSLFFPCNPAAVPVPIYSIEGISCSRSVISQNLTIELLLRLHYYTCLDESANLSYIISGDLGRTQQDHDASGESNEEKVCTKSINLEAEGRKRSTHYFFSCQGQVSKRAIEDLYDLLKIKLHVETRS
jgi:hypothetical protein